MDSSMKVSEECTPHQTLTPSNSWLSGSQLENANSKLLFISVEYIKDSNGYKLSPPVNYPENTSCVDLVQHVNPLDPNMSLAACFNPTNPQCNENDISFNGGVAVQDLLSNTVSSQHLINSNTNTYVDHNAIPDTSSQNISSSLHNNDSHLLKDLTNNKYLLNENNSTSEVLQLVPGSEAQHEVELLITDQVTGISYNISTQEYLVERCLADEQHLLDTLTPTHFLENDLLTIDDAALKSELSDVGEPTASDTLQPGTGVINLPSLIPQHIAIKTESYDDDCEPVYSHDNLRRSQRQINVHCDDNEEQLLLSEIQAISDKAIETRARATLPATYLSIIKKCNGEYGVFARKMIPKCTQFGPVEGLLVVNNRDINDDSLQLLVDCGTGSAHRLDVSDEHVSNWMCFVRKAKSYSEQNLLITQIENSLFYISNVSIMPKQELLVGYGSKYATQYQLPLLKPPPDQNKMWNCFECYETFETSRDLQNHLNIHDDTETGSLKINKNLLKKKRVRKFLMECKYCMETFSFSFKDYELLKKHLTKHSDVNSDSIEDHFSVISYNCEKCGLSFESEVLLVIHNLQHKTVTNTVINNLSCPKCKKKFESQPQLIGHVNHHCRDKYAPIVSAKGYKCPICYKVFASDERIQCHMFVHGSDDTKPLKCEICDKRFLKNSALTCHLKTHRKDQKHFECPICKEMFDRVAQLKLHVTQHCKDGKFTCPHCNKIFNEYSIIRKHIRAFHCDKKHYCSYCSKTFQTLDKLRMHLLRHSDHKEFLCADCGKQFKRKDKLKEHTKRIHMDKTENVVCKPVKNIISNQKFTPRVLPTEYHRFIYKCHACLVGFKRRGMLVNHLAKQHPDIRPDSVPELNLPILRTTRDYYCQYCDKIYKSSSKRKAHILKNHPGQALPISNKRQGNYPDVSGLPNPSFSQTVGSITTPPQSCQWCHKQYASKAKLLQHQRKKHADLIQATMEQTKSHCIQPEPTRENQDIADVILDADAFKKELKFLQDTDNEVISDARVGLSDTPHEDLYEIVSVASNAAMSFNNSNDINNECIPPDSRLYVLLTTGNGQLHPPR